MLPKNLKTIYEEYLPVYQSRPKLFKPDKLRALILKSAKEAKTNYEKLNRPITCSKNIYIRIWVRRAIDKDLVSRSTHDTSPKHFTSLLKSSSEYFLLLPEKKRHQIKRKFFATPPEKRKEVWESFNLPFKKIEKSFIKMTTERIKLASKQGYDSYLSMLLDKNKIPQTEYKSFVKNNKKIIQYCNQQLPDINNLATWFYSEFNQPCFICQIPKFPFKTIDNVIDPFTRKYKVLNRFKHKVDIKLGNNSQMFYKEEKDIFKIIINRNNNIRHRITDLIHELSHVVNYLQSFSKGINPLEKGSYWREKEAFKIELSVIKKVSPLLLKASFGEILRILWRLSFETELYKNPHQDLSKLYAKTFNQYFKKAKQKRNPLYILDDWIILQPFMTLPHAIAQSQVIYEKLIKKQITSNLALTNKSQIPRSKLQTDYRI